MVFPLVSELLDSKQPLLAFMTLEDGINTVIGHLHFSGEGHNGYTKSTWKITEMPWMGNLPPQLASGEVSGSSGKHRCALPPARVVGRLFSMQSRHYLVILLDTVCIISRWLDLLYIHSTRPTTCTSWDMAQSQTCLTPMQVKDLFVIVANCHRGSGSALHDADAPSAQATQAYMASLKVPLIWTGYDYIPGSENEVERDEGDRVTFRQGYVTDGRAKKASAVAMDGWMAV